MDSVRRIAQINPDRIAIAHHVYVNLFFETLAKIKEPSHPRQDRPQEAAGFPHHAHEVLPENDASGNERVSDKRNGV
jgi:hypothetical protein